MAKKKKIVENTEEVSNLEENASTTLNNQIVASNETISEATSNKKNTEEISKKPEDKQEEKTEEKQENDFKKIVDEKETKKYNNYEQNLERKSGKKGIIACAIIGILVLILALFSVIFSLVNLNNITILDGVTVRGMSLKGLTKEEAKNKLTEVFTSQFTTDITLMYNDYSQTINGEQIDAAYNVDEIVNKAYQIGRSGDILQNNYAILNCWLHGVNIEPEFSYNPELLENIAEDVSAKLPGGVTQSSYYIENKQLIITAGKEGVVPKKDELKEKILKAVESETEEDNTVIIPVEVQQPDAIDIEKIHSEIYVEPKDAYYTTEPFTIYPHVEGVDFDMTIDEAKALIVEPAEEYTIKLKYTTPAVTTNKIGSEAFPDLLSSFSTKYDASNKNRSNNLLLASNKINGTVLLPGEEFSYNKVVGERTIAAGYKEAHIFAGGKVTDGLGGGICQISTTLYDAVLYANLEITERRNHQMPAGYVKNGLDATVVYGSIDFKFVNNRKYPIKIVSEVKNGVAKMSIYGIKEEVEYEVRLEPVVLSYTPYKTEYITDASLASGQQVVKQNGSNGCKTVTYKYLYLNGNMVSKTELSRDTYKAINKVVRVGP